jgi:hypothetical protein
VAVGGEEEREINDPRRYGVLFVAPVLDVLGEPISIAGKDVNASTPLVSPRTRGVLDPRIGVLAPLIPTLSPSGLAAEVASLPPERRTRWANLVEIGVTGTDGVEPPMTHPEAENLALVAVRNEIECDAWHARVFPEVNRRSPENQICTPAEVGADAFAGWAPTTEPI